MRAGYTYVRMTQEEIEYIRANPYASNKELSEYIGCSNYAITHQRKKMGHPGIQKMRENFVETIKGKWKKMTIEERETMCTIAGLKYKTVRSYIYRKTLKKKTL